MSQRRKIRRQVVPIGPSTRDKAIAYLGALGVVLATALIVWLLRPGDPDPYGLTGGMANRQPRVTWLVVLSFAAVVGAFVTLHRVARGKYRRHRAWVGVVVLALAVGAGFAWPGGLLRKGPVPIDLPPIATLPSTVATPTTLAGDTATTLAGDTATTLAGDTATTLAGDTAAPTTTTPATGSTSADATSDTTATPTESSG